MLLILVIKIHYNIYTCESQLNAVASIWLRKPLSTLDQVAAACFGVPQESPTLCELSKFIGSPGAGCGGFTLEFVVRPCEGSLQERQNLITGTAEGLADLSGILWLGGSLVGAQ